MTKFTARRFSPSAIGIYRDGVLIGRLLKYAPDADHSPWRAVGSDGRRGELLNSPFAAAKQQWGNDGRAAVAQLINR